MQTDQSAAGSGGRWINFGTLSFHVADPTLRYSAEECAEIIAATGFESPDIRETSLPYLCSLTKLYESGLRQ